MECVTGKTVNIRKRLMFISAVSQIELDPFGIHGVRHWHNVYNNCVNLWRLMDPEKRYEVEPTDDWFFWCFAMLHDCRRENDTMDIEHPFRAAKMVPDDDTEFNTRLRMSILGHSSGKLTNDRLAAVCWDADRLDLPRVGINPNPDFMSTTVGVELAEQMNRPPAGYDPDTDDPRLSRRRTK